MAQTDCPSPCPGSYLASELMLMLIMNDGCVSSVPKVQDMINKIDDGSGFLDFSDFCLVMGEKNKEQDQEIHFKDTFRVFSKDEEGQGFFAIQSD